MRDIRLARARLLVPDGCPAIQRPRAEANFDVDREIFADAQHSAHWISVAVTAVASPERPHIQFGDAVSEDPQTLALIAKPEAATTDTKVRILHPD